MRLNQVVYRSEHHWMSAEEKRGWLWKMIEEWSDTIRFIVVIFGFGLDGFDVIFERLSVAEYERWTWKEAEEDPVA